MNSVYDVADYIIFILSEMCDDLTNMKINKLLYYAQGHCLKRTGHALFSDTIEAWEHGPIVPAIYKKYSKYGDSAIKEFDASCGDKLDDESKQLLLDVARVYGGYTAGTLRNMTHEKDSPWDQVYLPGEMHTEISQKAIKDYFQRRVNPIRPIELPIAEEDFIGYRDQDGYLVLPKEWDE